METGDGSSLELNQTESGTLEPEEEFGNEYASVEGALSDRDVDVLMARIDELERRERERHVYEPAPLLGTKKGRKLTFGPPFAFDGSRDDQKVNIWLARIDTQIRMNAKAFGAELDDEEKLLLAEFHMEDTTIRQYHVRVQQEGPFVTYDDFVQWIRGFYGPSDLIAINRSMS